MRMMLDHLCGQLRRPELRSIRLCLLLVGAIVASSRLSPADDTTNVTITGRVIDRETGQPVRLGCVVPGIRSKGTTVEWDTTASVPIIRGRYEMRCKAGAVPQLLQAIVTDYQIAVSKEMPAKAGTATVDFELTKLRAFEATVRAPDGKPAAEAKVAVAVENSVVVFENGEIDQFAQAQTDQFGRFQLRLREERFCLAIAHSSGYAIYRPAPHSNHRLIQLDPWTRVEGTILFDGKPLADTTVRIDRPGFQPIAELEPFQIMVAERAGTDAHGRFVFDRVLSGSGRLSYYLPSRPESHLTTRIHCRAEVKFPIGQTIRLDFGRQCRSVVGKLQPLPKAKRTPTWSDLSVEVESQTTVASQPKMVFDAAVDSDGSFRIDNVPAGTFTLEIVSNSWTRFAVYRTLHFTISDASDKASAKPFDLGVLPLTSIEQ
jgi:hypothetical protein